MVIFTILLLLSGDRNSVSIQNMEQITDSEPEQVPEDLGKLTEADKARTGRVSSVLSPDTVLYFQFFFSLLSILLFLSEHDLKPKPQSGQSGSWPYAIP